MNAMRRLVLPLLLISPLLARDDQQLALALKAQTDFDRVAGSILAPFPETAACAQSQAAILSVSLPEDQSQLHYRKGYCLLAGATVTGNRQDFLAAAAELDKAIETWPLRTHKPVKNAVTEPVSSGLRSLAAVAHLLAEGETAARPLLAAAVAGPACSGAIMAETRCQQWVNTARLWLGRMELRAGSLDGAATDSQASPETGWPEWVQGRKAFDRADYREAVTHYTTAIQIWKSVWTGPGPGFVRRLGPRPDLAQGLTDLGGAQLLAGNTKEALGSLDAALKLDPASARIFYLRARTREISGHAAESLEDYNLAARAAFAASEDLASGEAHLYRGILLFRRKDYARAEDEFSSALNFSIATQLRPDAEAWRHLAAVASGFCGTARQNLEKSLATVSPYFPKDEARAVAASCSITAE
jgi:tetratricopeptide (TPR) repeat protein